MNAVTRQERETDFYRVYEVVRSAFEGEEHTKHDGQNLVVRLCGSDASRPSSTCRRRGLGKR